MDWRRIGANTAGQTSPPPPRPCFLDVHAPHLDNGAGGTAGFWPIGPNFRRKHFVGRAKVVSWYYDFEENTTIEDDADWGPWDYFEPTRWMAGGSSMNDAELMTRYGNTCYFEVAAPAYPWKIVWRWRTRPVESSTWSYETFEQIMVPGEYQVEFDADSGQVLEFADAMLLVPAEGV